MTTQRLWFVRRGQQVQGPFPELLIARFIVLGRVAERDEVSLDQQYWRKPEQVPELADAVHQLLGTFSSDDPAWREERAKAALRWLDDRKSPDPRASETPGQAQTWKERRAGGERRRAAETVDEHAYREGRAEFENWQRTHRERYGKVWLALAFLVAAVVAVALFQRPVNPVKVGLRIHSAECDHAPRKGVNWSGCVKDGYLLAGVDLRAAVLVGASLRGADLRYADLTQADLSQANLAGIDLTGAKLGGALWPDGRRCAENSVGACR